MSDKALEMAAEALDAWTFAHYEKQVFSDLPDAAGACVAGFLDGLLADLPEEAVEAARRAAIEAAGFTLEATDSHDYRDEAEGAIDGFLRSLRGSTPGHREGRDDG